MSATAVKDDQRKIYNKILVKEFMSSEESALETIDGMNSPVLMVKTLSWRCERINRFLKKLDDRTKAKKNPSRQSKLQTLPRVQGDLLTRPKPFGFPDDFWGFRLNDDGQ